MMEESHEQSAALIEEARGQGSTLQVLTNLADAFFSLLDRPEPYGDMRLHIELWAEALHNPRVMEPLRRELASIKETIADIVRRGQARGDIIADLNPEAVARVLISFFDGLLVQKAVDVDVDVWQYVAVMKAMGTGLLGGGEPQDLGTNALTLTLSQRERGADSLSQRERGADSLSQRERGADSLSQRERG